MTSLRSLLRAGVATVAAATALTLLAPAAPAAPARDTANLPTRSQPGPLSRLLPADKHLSQPGPSGFFLRPADRVGTYTGSKTVVAVTVTGLKSRAAATWAAKTIDRHLSAYRGQRGPGTDILPIGKTFTVKSVRVLDMPAPSAALTRSLSRLKAERPWYTISTRRVGVTAFQFSGANKSGKPNRQVSFTGVWAALPAGDDVVPGFAVSGASGSTVHLVWDGPALTQAQFSKARAAFAFALGIRSADVTVRPTA